MRNLVDQHIRGYFDESSGAHFADVVFERCQFSNCGLSMTKDLRKRTFVRNVDLRECSINGCTVGPAIFEDVSLEELRTPDLLIAWSPFLKRVALRGRVGRIRINQYPNFADFDSKLIAAFADARSQFYAETDWALDISEAIFQSFDVRGIPLRLIRRDSTSQVVVTRERAAQPDWREMVASSNKYWPQIIDLALEDGEPEVLLVAPKALSKRKYRDLVDGLDDLRQLGVAEPD